MDRGNREGERERQSDREIRGGREVFERMIAEDEKMGGEGEGDEGEGGECSREFRDI